MSLDYALGALSLVSLQLNATSAKVLDILMSIAQPATVAAKGALMERDAAHVKEVATAKSNAASVMDQGKWRWSHER